jgi:hypothetical protein
MNLRWFLFFWGSFAFLKHIILCVFLCDISSYTTSKFAIDNQMILNFESCYKRSISGRLLGDYVVPFISLNHIGPTENRNHICGILTF